MTEFAALPADLPWHLPAYLLLDGVAVPHLAQLARRWNHSAHCLYRHTCWHELADISPYLIALRGVDDPLLRCYHDHVQAQWGYLLFSAADSRELLQHYQGLLTVELADGTEVMPRIADPAVARSLLQLAERCRSPRWFGPVQHLCVPDSFQATWTRHQRPSPPGARAGHTTVLRLTDEEMTALGEVEFRRSVQALDVHLRNHFPGYLAASSATERLRHIQRLAEDAYARGFTSAQALTLYLNTLAHLGEDPSQHPQEILELLKLSPSEPPLTRLQRAAEMAERHAATSQGRSI